MLYHFNKATGRVGQCTASVRECPHGKFEEHYTTKEGAALAYEKLMANSTVAKGQKKEISKRSNPEVTKALSRWSSLLEPLDSNFVKDFEAAFSGVSGSITAPPSPLSTLASGTPLPKELDTWDSRLVAREDPFRSGAQPIEHYLTVLIYNDDDYDGYDEHADSTAAAEAHPDYVGAQGGGYGSDYIRYAFRTDPQRVADHRGDAEDFRVQQLKRELLKQVESGRRTPWSALAAANNPDFKSSTISSVSVAAKKAESNKLLKELQGLDKLKNRALLGEAEEDELKPAFGQMTWHVLKKINRLKEAHKDLSSMRESVDQAKALPEDSALREYLLGDRGTFTYTVKEKQGRRNVDVTKVGHRGALIEKSLETAESEVRMATTDIGHSMDGLSKKIAEKAQAKARADTDLKLAEERRINSWREEWPAADEKLPEVPEWFMEIAEAPGSQDRF